MKITLGPSFQSVDLPIDNLMWVFLADSKGRVLRAAGTLHYEDFKLTREWIRGQEEKWGGRFIGFLIEPSYNHGGYYDPCGGIYWEDEYEAALAKHGKKASRRFIPPFYVCPRCSTAHTAPTWMCRGCEYKASTGLKMKKPVSKGHFFLGLKMKKSNQRVVNAK